MLANAPVVVLGAKLRPPAAAQAGALDAAAACSRAMGLWVAWFGLSA